MTETTKEKILYISGMHCASCEILIEKKLLKKEGIQAADASLKNGEVRLILDESKHLNPHELNQEFEPLGYRFSNHPVGSQSRPLFYKDSTGHVKANKDKLKKLEKNALLALALLVVFFLVERAQLGRYVSIEPGATLGAFFMLGLVAGVSSCAALIGGLLLTLTKHWHEQYIDSESSAERIRPHILFHIGRLGAFFIFGGVLGAVGSAISFNNTTVYALVVIVISVIMLLVALQMLNVEWARRFTFRLPKSITRAAANDTTKKNAMGPFVAGALTFFLPCGFTLIAQGVALASGNALFGGLVMLYFAFGTLPVLLGISISGIKFTSRPHLTGRFSAVAGILILFFSLYNINGQFNVLGLPSLSDVAVLQPQPKLTAPQPAYAAEKGEQVLSLVAKDFDYIPSGSTTLKAGVPTKLIVDNQGILGCGSYLASRGLIDGFVALQRGQNVIDLGTPKAGTYKITCSMGMVPPVTITVK